MAKKIVAKMERKGLTMETDREQFAMALKTYRLRNGKTQRQLAEEWDISRYTILRAEKAHPISWMMAYRLFSKLSLALENE